ncbi:MAG: hypothetical protein JNN28_12085 [Saprospiraceae bacterium]|nr:hypothetical protein [Saprospiraceae bacterium]
MQKRLFLAILMACVAISAYTQNLPVDYHNKPVKNGQRHTTEKFLHFLETGQIDSALNFISPSCLATFKNPKKLLFSYHQELVTCLNSTKLSLVIVYPEEAYNTYRCRYYNATGDYFYIDLYYPVGQPHALVAKFEKMSKKTLAAERKSLAKRQKEAAKDIPPPPPPPPGYKQH